MKPTPQIAGCAARLLAALLAAWVLQAGAQPTLENALDTTNLTWTTDPTYPWIYGDFVAFDGEDAAMCIGVPAAQRSWLRGTVNGPGILTYYWKASSEPEGDWLVFRVGQTNFLRLSGETDWELVSVPIPDGAQTLEWSYEKNAELDLFTDAAWLDTVRYTPGPTPPFIPQQPQDQTSTVGETATFTAAAFGTAPLHFQWQFKGTDLAGANGAAYTIDSVQTNHAGEYRLIVTNPLGAVTSRVAQLILGPDPLGVAVNSPHLTWITGGNGGYWFSQSDFSHDGRSAAQTVPILDGESCALRTTVNGPGQLVFWWSASSEANYDFLHFLVNESIVASLSGADPVWEQVSMELPPGETILEWIYLKDEINQEGLDAAWLDEVTFTPAGRFEAVGPLYAGGTFTVTISSKAGRKYALEYKDRLGGSTWTALPAVDGDGAVLNLTDPAPASAQRFYRIKEY